MKIEDKVVSLKLAKKMKELGWDFETERCWVMYSSEQGGNATYFLISAKEFNTNREYYIFPTPAPDAIEILNVIPGDKIKYYSQYLLEDFDLTNIVIRIFRDTQELGKMWCYLKEKKLI